MTETLENVIGLADLQKLLNDVPIKMEANIMRGALRAGADEMLIAARANCPTEDPGGSITERRKYKLYNGALRDSLHITTRKHGGFINARVNAGGKNKKTGADVYYAGWVEFGTAAHEIRPKGKKSLFFAGLNRTVIEHPGAKPHPFMRTAFDGGAAQAIAATAQYIKARLTKQGLDTSEILVEGDE